MPYPVNMAEGVTPPVLNPKSVSMYDRLYEAGVVTLPMHARRLQTAAFGLKFSDFHLNVLCAKNGEKNISNNNVKQKTASHSQIMRSRAM
jgi:hypothetical protein